MNISEDIFQGIGVEIRLNSPDDFLKIRETLTRIGISSKSGDTLYQSCHILHKRDRDSAGKSRYVIAHFKELFILDGKDSTLGEEDISRRNTVTNLLEEWELLTILDYEKSGSPVAPLHKLKIIPFSEKSKWVLRQKYTIGHHVKDVKTR
ncbi:MAG: translational repressor RegA [Anaerolineaceae bacterium]